MVNNQGGSVLLWILIAVVLLAGLTTAMNQGSRTSTGVVSDQQARLMATEIIQYGGTVRQAVNNLLLRGCSQDDLNFANDKWKRVNGQLIVTPNPNAPPNGSCDVFSPNGGGVSAHSFPQASLSSSGLPSAAWEPGSGATWRYDFAGVGSTQSDLALYTSFVRKEVCMEINKMMGINLSYIPQEGNLAEDSAYYYDIPEFKGKMVTCSHISGSAWSDEAYFVYHILIAN